MGQKIIINKGTILSQSEKGQYNFEYPSKKNFCLKTELECEILPWISFDNKIAILAQGLLSNTRDYKRNIFWVKNKDISKNHQ